MVQRPLLAFCLLLVACVGCDHASKQAATSLLAGAPALALAGDAVRFELVSNPGAFMSLGAALPETLRHILLLGVVPLLIALVCLGFARAARGSPGVLVGLALLAGGGVGNWIDRLMNGGAVTDFVSVGLGPLRTGIFNFADVAVIAGVCLVVLATREREEPASAR
jgi:signal peptidase II